MAIKIFCDVPGCGREMPQNNGQMTSSIKISDATHLVGAQHRFPGDVCQYCMIDAFKKLDDRPWPKVEIAAAPPRLPDARMMEAGADALGRYRGATFRGATFSRAAEAAWTEMYDAWKRSQP